MSQSPLSYVPGGTMVVVVCWVTSQNLSAENLKIVLGHIPLDFVSCGVMVVPGWRLMHFLSQNIDCYLQ